MLNLDTRFVNRERELAFLRESLARPRAELLIVYGRRRVGKTALLQEAARLSPVPVLFHVAAQTTRVDELSRLSARIADFFQDDVVRLQPFRAWEAVCAYLGQKAHRQRFAVMLDEFPYAVESDRALPSLLQAAWDHDLSKTPIKIILCGSSIGMMERIGLLPSSPLFGRRTGQWKLDPFGPEKLALLWPAPNLAELLRVYGVVGGAPLYIGRFDTTCDLYENIRAHILTKGSMLYEEVPFLLREELREPHVYQSLLSAMANGVRKFSELSSKTGLDRAHLTRYLAILAELRLVEREIPVTEAQPQKSRKGLYRITDQFISFWYRFVFAQRDRLETGTVAEVLHDVIKNELDTYLAWALEPVIGSLFRTRWRDMVPFEPAFFGRHWSEREEFDWVILDHARRNAYIVEVKWTGRPISSRHALSEMRRRAAHCAALDGCTLSFAVVSRTGFSDRPEVGDKADLIDLSDEKALPPGSHRRKA